MPGTGPSPPGVEIVFSSKPVDRRTPGPEREFRAHLGGEPAHLQGIARLQLESDLSLGVGIAAPNERCPAGWTIEREIRIGAQCAIRQFVARPVASAQPPIRHQDTELDIFRRKAVGVLEIHRIRSENPFSGQGGGGLWRCLRGNWTGWRSE